MKPILLAIALFGLAACATTPTVYQAQAGPGAVGYAETPIEHDRWRVSFQGGDSATPPQVTDLAIRRAAELTLAKGYDWFRIVGREVEGAPRGVHPEVSVGVGGGGGFVGGGGGIGFNFGGPHEAVAVTLEVLMGHGPAPREPDAYDARDVHRSLSPQA